MANTLSVAGATRVAWSLSDGVGSSKSDTQSSSRSITTGTGPNQANVAWSETFSTTGIGSAGGISSQMPVSSFGFSGSINVSVVKEAYLSVSTGPTGGYMAFTFATGVSPVRVNVGGVFHFADYLTGLVPPPEFIADNGITGAYSGQMTIVGNGTYQSN